jgi:hypothetical protein
MSAGKLLIAAMLAALLQAPVVAAEPGGDTPAAKLATAAQQAACAGASQPCGLDAGAVYCIAEKVCATALPGAALVRYDQLMDGAGTR